MNIKIYIYNVNYPNIYIIPKYIGKYTYFMFKFIFLYTYL